MLKALKVVSGGLLLAFVGCGVEGDVDEPITENRSALEAAGNDYGVAETFHTTGAIDFTNPMFLQLGTNPRSLRDVPRARPGLDDDGGRQQGAVQGVGRPRPVVQPGRRRQPARRRHLHERCSQGDLRPARRSSWPSPASRATSARPPRPPPVHHHRGRGSVRLPRDHQLVPQLPSADHMANETKMSSILNTSAAGAGHPGDARQPVQRRRGPPRAA